MWLTYIEGKNRKSNTLRGYKVNVNNHIIPSIGDIKIQKGSRINDKTIIHNNKWTLCIPSEVSIRFSRFLKENSLRKIRFHDLRHTHASLLVNEYGMNVTAVRDRLGHSRASTTMNCYISGTSKQQLSGVEKLMEDII